MYLFCYMFVALLYGYSWQAARLQQTYEAHSGYCFEGTVWDYLGLSHASDAAHHDYHHSVNRGNFGSSWMVRPSLFIVIACYRCCYCCYCCCCYCCCYISYCAVGIVVLIPLLYLTCFVCMHAYTYCVW